MYISKARKVKVLMVIHFERLCKLEKTFASRAQPCLSTVMMVGLHGSTMGFTLLRSSILVQPSKEGEHSYLKEIIVMLLHLDITDHA